MHDMYMNYIAVLANQYTTAEGRSQSLPYCALVLDRITMGAKGVGEHVIDG